MAAAASPLGKRRAADDNDITNENGTVRDAKRHCASRATTWPRESALALVVRAQLTTSARKTDVYWAHLPADDLTLGGQVDACNDTLVVVKGPLPQANVERAMATIAWKQDNDLPTARTWAVRLIPDRWPAGVPLGLRNTLRVKDERGDYAPCWFLVSESLVPKVALQCVMRSSARWPRTEVAATSLTATRGESVYAWDLGGPRWHAATIQERDDCVLALALRYALGLGDNATRNFVRARIDGVWRVVAVDEDDRGDTRKSFARTLAAKARAVLRAWCEARRDVLAAIIGTWRALPGNETTEARVQALTCDPAVFVSLVI